MGLPDIQTSVTKKRPTISLCCIAKNEEKNVARFLESFKGAVDEVIFVDTGSIDKTVEIAYEYGAKVFHFDWINDFAAARNFSFSHATSDFVIWSDLDDVLHNKEAFIQWRDYAMEFSDMFFATYNYALDKDGKPIVSFLRERVFRRSVNPVWQYPLHEGVIPLPNWQRDYAIGWAINHLRDTEDIVADKSRNIKILEEMKEKQTLDPRLQFYLGKELYESQRPVEAVEQFEKALLLQIEHHDRLLAFQYGAYAAIQCAETTESISDKHLYYEKALDFCSKGIQRDPNRAEFHVTAGDIHVRTGNIVRSVPYYAAAKRCISDKAMGSPYEGALYSFLDCYGLNPTLQLAKIYLHLGKIDQAKKEAQEAVDLFDNQEAKDMLEEINRIVSLTTIDNGQIETSDIVFSCPPQTVYEFDEELYKTKPMGGSETALIEVARNLKKITGRRVLVFNMREKDLVADSGVEYISGSKLNAYFANFKPAVHVAWRHNIRLTKAPTYLWCHDLVTQGVESQHNFDKILCLTPFHKNFVMGKQNVPEDKIIVTRNGIVPERFHFPEKPKNKNKLVWMSSPDRGLVQAMEVCDEVIKEFPDIELHVYNSVENLRKYGPQMITLADQLEFMIKARPYVKYHGFTEQSKMYQEVSDAVVWCHPCNFIETFCITGLEMLGLKVFPVTRRLGGLQNTLAEAEKLGHAVMLDHGCSNEWEKRYYVREIIEALQEKKWEKIEFDVQEHAWASVAFEWADFMGLLPDKKEIKAA